MSDGAKQSFYQVLGIERDADERGIKKAYFALVRKFPPETHPEEFKRIREAYEVLSNPQSRADYDAVDRFDQYGEQVAARLKAGMACMEAGDYATAQRELHEVLRLQPTLYFARDLLGMAYLNADQAEQALAHFDALVEAQPDNAIYRLHKGYAHYHLKQPGPAMAAYRQAARLDATDTRVMVAMADCLAGQQQYDAALAELDRAIQLDGAVDFQDFVFFMRKVQVQLLRDRGDLAEKELDQIFAILPDDADTRKYVATRLASLAADLFAMKRSPDANRLLQRCQQLDPTRASMSFQFPPRSRLLIAALPAASQEWLRTQSKQWVAGKLKHNAWTGPIVLLLGAILLSVIALNAGFNSRRLWSTSKRAQMALLLTGAPLLLGLGIRRVRRVAKSPYGRYTTIHPLHLMQVDVDRVTVWPLVNLHDVSLTHHSTNGIYQHTAVRMDFAGTICTLTISGQQASVDWANQVLGQRRRVLELMSAGLLDAEEGFDLVPPAQLTATHKPTDSVARKRSLRYYLAFAGVGLVLTSIALPHNKGIAEREAWRQCRLYPSVRQYRDYLELFPTGNHVTEALMGLENGYDQAVSRYQSRATGADPRAMQAVVDVLQALKQGHTRRVRVSYEGSFDFSATKDANNPALLGVIAAEPSFTPALNRVRERSITSSLRRAFGDILTHEVIAFDDGGVSYLPEWSGGRPRQEASPVTFVIKYRVSPSGSVYESTTGGHQRLFGIIIDWDVAIRFDGEANDRFRLPLRSSPAKNIRYTSDSHESDSVVLPYTKMAESAFYEFEHQLAASFGVTPAGAAQNLDGTL